MAQRAYQALTIAPRYQKPANFNGTETAWRVMCDLYPAAETTEIIMAVMEYCSVRNLDPFKKPVHIVPMYNSKLRRRVQVVMQGINEIETTAHRTNKFAGLDEPKWGPTIKTTFRGTVENDDGSTVNQEMTVEYPESCTVTAYRLVGNERRAFTEQLFWLESYATAGFKTTLPNARWQKAPRQMLHKCTKAAVLRLAFPEEGLGYAAEEMEDQQTTADGVTIEGKIDYGDASLSDRGIGERGERGERGEQPTREPSGAATDPLEETDGPTWLANLGRLLAAAKSQGEVVEIAGHRRVVAAIEDAPIAIRRDMDEMFRKAHERLAAPAGDRAADDPPSGERWIEPALAAMLAEVDRLDAISLAGLGSNAQWRKRRNDLIPPDQDTLEEHITARIGALRAASRTTPP